MHVKSIVFGSISRTFRRRLCSLKAIVCRSMSWSDAHTCPPIGFGGESPNRFVAPSFNWSWKPISYIIYRYTIASYQLLWLVLVVIEWGTGPHYSVADSKWKWFLYVSNWSYLLLTVYFVFAALAVTVYYRGTPDTLQNDVEQGTNDNTSVTKRHLPVYLSVMWFLQVLAYSPAVAVTLLYWILDYNPAGNNIHIYGVHVHGINVLLVFIDSVIVANPFRFIHFVYPSFYALMYFAFTVIYYAEGGLNPNGESYIYKGHLDWENKPELSSSIAALTVTVVAPFLHSMFWYIFKFKESILNTSDQLNQ